MKKLIFIIPVIFLLFKACKTDKGCVDNNEYRYQSETELSVVPYKDFSELTFINKTTRDTSIFIGQGYVYDWGKYLTQEECSQTYNLQRRYIVFNCTKNTDQISIENTFTVPWTTLINFGFNNNYRKTSYADFGYPYSLDSINIEGVKYINITRFSPEQSTISFGFLFSRNKGIVQLINPKSNDTLNLISVKL